MSASLAWLGSLTLCVGLLACASRQEPTFNKVADRPPPIQTLAEDGRAPKWVTQKRAAFVEQRAVFYGVGNAAGLVNPSLKRRAAEAAARRDLAQEFRVYVAALQKQYLAETTGGALDRHSVEQHVDDAMKQVAEQTLSGSSIVEYWENPTRNEAYALARLDLAGFLETVKRYRSPAAQTRTLDEQVREFFRDNAEEMHEQLRHEQRGPTTVPVPAPPVMPATGASGATASGGAGSKASGETAHPVIPGKQPRPDPATFQTGDVIWPRQPWVFIPFNSEPSGTYDSDKAGWQQDKQEFVERINQNPQASDYDRAVAAELNALTFEGFRSRYLSGTEEDEVQAAGWLPWIGHVAMIHVRDGTPWVVESTFHVGVRTISYDDWIKERGKSLIWHGRLKGLDTAARARLAEEALKQLKKPYRFFNLNLLDDQGFYCSKFVWFLAWRALGLALDANPDPHRKFWFSPRQLIRSPSIQLLTNPVPYTGEEGGTPGGPMPRPLVQVVPPSQDRSCEAGFSQCVARCTGDNLQVCTEQCCCQHGGTQCAGAPDCCPVGR